MRAGLAGARRTVRDLCLYGAVVAATGCDVRSADASTSARKAECRPLSFVTTRSDTLRGPKGYPMVDPIAIGRVEDRIAVADRADKAFKLYTLSGLGTAIIGSPADTLAPLFMLESAFIGKSGLSGVDHSEGVIRTFDVRGGVVQVESLPRVATERLRAVRLFDDTLRVSTRYLFGNEARDLVEVTRPGAGRARRMHRRAEYFESLPTLLRGMISVHADGARGTVFVAATGDDSVFAHDGGGRSLGRGLLVDHAGESIRRWKDLIAENGGQALTADSSFVGDDHWAVTNVIATEPDRAIVQLRRPIPFGLRRHDLNEESLLIAVALDHTARVVHSVGWLRFEGTLVGHSPWHEGGAALIRTLEGDSEAVEVLSVKLVTTGGSAVCR